MNNIESEGRKELELWFCNGCEAVHLTAGGMRLSFNQGEFSAFTKMVVETYYSGWSRSEGQLLPAHFGDLDHSETTVSAETIH